ncbi:DUF396-domain-containing protein [Piedraia hortae CBS 480.64]|uniref:DUF396-domain-containing protein n=1 Tax=Piedraia hortae CBS 480.64 TaxID=1314780 RepID=A0A6A7C883_9PEZI|nr:DUF396-domain-containing protein [Piedraia hortae CBS 480.64]
MWILPLLGYLGLVLGFLFLALAIASGLYYLSEVVEEHTVPAKKALTRMIYGVIAVQLLLVVIDDFPWGPSTLSIISHVIYLQNLRRFPVVKLTDPIFLLSCILVAVNHWVWFRHFSAPLSTINNGYGASPYSWREAQKDLPTFTEVASFFGLEVWLVPFALFISLSAGENVLPSMGSEYATGPGSSYVVPGREPLNTTAPMGTRTRRSGTQSGMAKAAVNGAREWVSETGELLGLWKGERTRPV